MNWGTQLHRDAPDRCALRFETKGQHPLTGVGGGNYSKSSLGQSILIVDEQRQNPVPAKVVAHDIEGPVQYVMARSDQHFPGTVITRTFALLGPHVVVFDRLVSPEPRTVDWCLRYAGGGEGLPGLVRSVDLGLNEVPGSFTDKPGERDTGVTYGKRLKSKSHFVATTGETWCETRSGIRMLGAPDTEVLCLAVHAAFSAWKKAKETGVPVLMVRRRNVTTTDYVTVFSAATRSVERVSVTTPDGAPAVAVGVRLTLKDDTVLHAVVSYEPDDTEIVVGKVRTKDRFASDYR